MFIITERVFNSDHLHLAADIRLIGSVWSIWRRSFSGRIIMTGNISIFEIDIF